MFLIAESPDVPVAFAERRRRETKSKTCSTRECGKRSGWIIILAVAEPFLAGGA